MGCGRVGSTLARSLEDRNHTVSVIDSEPDAFRRLGADFNGDKVVGMGFDQVVLACHSDQALALLEDAHLDERDILGAIPYQANETVLHTDARLLPRHRKAWAAWVCSARALP